MIDLTQNNPSVTFGDSSLYTREPLTQKPSAIIFVCLLSIGKAYTEPRDYRVVFIIQKISAVLVLSIALNHNSVCKPGSVENGHQSSLTVTDELRLSPCHPRTYVGQTSDCGVASDRVYSKPMLP